VQEFYKRLLENKKKGNDKYDEILVLLESIHKKQVLNLEIKNKSYFTWHELIYDIIVKKEDINHFKKSKVIED